jgi:O-antigen biosynthesis protein
MTGHADYIAVLRGGARLARDAVAELTTALERFPSDVAYGDSIERHGRRRILVERPDFSPVRFSRRDDLGDLVVIRAVWLRDRDAQDLSSLIREVDPARVLHVPAVLSIRTDRRVLDAPMVPAAGTVEPLVSVIIPTRGTAADVRGARRVLVVELIREILARSSYRALEFVVVADDATPQPVIDDLDRLDGDIRLVRWSEPFNFSAKINRGAAHARGELLLLLNDDIEPITPDWIRTMVDLAGDPAVGAVGATLLYEDGSLQHAGHLYEAEGAGHVAHAAPGEYDDPVGSLSVDRDASGVSAACVVVRRETFIRVGGMTNLLPGNYNDVDFCLKVRNEGLRLIVTPRAALYHYESKTRDSTIAATELAVLRRRWRSRIQVDAYWPISRGR